MNVSAWFVVAVKILSAKLAVGAIVSTLMLNTVDDVAFPAASVDVAVKVFTPWAKLVTLAVK